VVSLKRHFWRKRKRSEKRRGLKRIDPLKQACIDLRRPELYEPLSRVLIANPRIAERYFGDVLKRRSYRTAAGVMLYRSNLKEAKRYFGMALKASQSDAAKQRLAVSLQNLSKVLGINREIQAQEEATAEASKEASMNVANFVSLPQELSISAMLSTL
jgi:hypothetical protein